MGACYLECLLTEQSPCGANRFSASQETPRILWNSGGSLPRLQDHATCSYPERTNQFILPVPRPEDLS